MIFALRALLIAAVVGFAGPLQAAPLNIVAIGASNTSGFGVGAQSAYPALLQAILRKKGIDANVTNAGVAGDVTAGMLNRLDGAVPEGNQHRHFAAGRQRSPFLRHQGSSRRQYRGHGAKASGTRHPRHRL